MAIISNKAPVAAENLKPGQSRDVTTLPKIYSGNNISAAGTTTTGLMSGVSQEYKNQIGTKHAAYLTTARATDTYETICDLSGAGTFFGAIATAVVNTTDDVTFQITVDGVATEISFTSTFPRANEGGSRAMIGGCFMPIGDLPWAYSGTAGQQFTGWGDSDEGSDFLTLNGTIITVPYPLVATLGRPRIIFDTDLKVEVKTPTACATGQAHYPYALYLLGHQI